MFCTSLLVNTACSQPAMSGDPHNAVQQQPLFCPSPFSHQMVLPTSRTFKTVFGHTGHKSKTYQQNVQQVSMASGVHSKIIDCRLYSSYAENTLVTDTIVLDFVELHFFPQKD